MYKIILALRYLLKRRITCFAILAVTLCVFIVVVVMTVMQGLVGNFKAKNHQFVGDCVVGTESLVGFAYYEDFMQRLEQADFVAAVSPVIKSYALISKLNSDSSSGVEIMGLDPVRHSRATGFGESLYFNKNNVSKAFVPSYDPNLPGCVLGIDLAMERRADNQYPTESQPWRIGFSVSCVPLTAKGAPAKAGAGLINSQTFYYSDLSHSGLARVDGSMVYVPFEQAQLLCEMGDPVSRASAVHIKFRPGVNFSQAQQKVLALWQQFKQDHADQTYAYLLDTVRVESWKENRRTFISTMEKEELMMMVMFVFVAITTVFIILVVFYMIISHKSRDIGILKSIGVSQLGIIELFCGFSALVGLIGAIFGVVAGWLFLVNINRIEDFLFERIKFQLWDRSIYAIGEIPNQVEWPVLAVIIFAAITACLIGAFVPAWQAAGLKPVDTLQVSQL